MVYGKSEKKLPPGPLKTWKEREIHGCIPIKTPAEIIGKMAYTS
jgi:hypothetical protein